MPRRLCGPIASAPPISFHPRAGIQFRFALLDAFSAVPHRIWRRLQSYAGAPTLIRSMRGPYTNSNGHADWTGLSLSTRFQQLQPASLPLEARILTRLGRHQLVVAEHHEDDCARRYWRTQK